MSSSALAPLDAAKLIVETGVTSHDSLEIEVIVMADAEASDDASGAEHASFSTVTVETSTWVTVRGGDVTVMVGASPVANTVVGTKESCVLREVSIYSYSSMKISYHCPSSPTIVETPALALLLVLMPPVSSAACVFDGI